MKYLIFVSLIFTSCVTSTAQIEYTYGISFTTFFEDVDNCKFVRNFRETSGSSLGGPIGQQAAKERLADRAQDYGVDTILIFSTSYWDGGVSAKGYICAAH